MIIGGIQENYKQNNMYILFYRTDNYRDGCKGSTAAYEISVDFKPAIADEKDFEICIN